MPGAYGELKGVALEAFRNLSATLQGKAMHELGLSRDDVIVRMLCPEDVKLDSEDSTSKYRWWFTLSSTGTTANTLINNRSIDDNKFIGIYGVTIPTANTASQLEITRKGSVARKWNVQAAGYMQDNALYFDDPFTCDQNTTLTISCYASSIAAAGPSVILHGIVAEKRGLNINP